MTSTSARILVCASDETEQRVRDALRDRDVALDFAKLPRNLQKYSPDLLMIDSDRYETERGQIPPTLPVIVFAPEPKSPLGPLHDVMTTDWSAAEIQARVSWATRLSTVRHELASRSGSALEYGLDPITPPSGPAVAVAEARVLTVAGNPVDAVQVEAALSKTCHLTVTDDPFTAIEMMESTPFDAVVVILPNHAPADDYVWVCTAARANSRLFHLPIIFVADRDSAENAVEAFSSGASEVLTKPVAIAGLRDICHRLMCRQAFRRNLLQACQDSHQSWTRDGATGLYRREFLDIHLENEINDTARRKKHLSLAIFSITQISDDEIDDRRRRRYLRHLGQMTNRLIRGEDLAARYDRESIVILMPDTSATAAIAVARRIVAVVNNTVFEFNSGDAPNCYLLRAGLTQRQPYDKGIDLIQRAQTDSSI